MSVWLLLFRAWDALIHACPDAALCAVLRAVLCRAAAIIRRVLLVLLAAVGLGTALFYLGLEYAFPKY